MRRLIDVYCKALDSIIGLTLAIMVVLVFGNVVLRYGFNSGITVSEEISRWLFVWLTFLGSVAAMRDHGHLGSDLIVSRLPVVGKKLFFIVGHVLMLYINWLMFYGSWTQSKINLDVEAPVTGLPMAIFYAVGLIFSASASVLLLRDLYLVLTGQISETDLVAIKESEDEAMLKEIEDSLGHQSSFTSSQPRKEQRA